jgi:predicted ATP-dependent protease
MRCGAHARVLIWILPNARSIEVAANSGNSHPMVLPTRKKNMQTESISNNAGAGNAVLPAQLNGLRLAPAALYRACVLPTLPAALPLAGPPVAALGQQRAIEALDFGIGIQRHGYNIFVYGENGSERHALVLDRLRQRAAQQDGPPDWCYVNNFDDPRRPRVLRLPSGRGEQLRVAMRRLIEELLAVLPGAFERDEYRGRRQALDDEMKQKHEVAFGDLARKAEEKNIALVRSPMGFTLLPMRKGEPLRPEQVQRMTDAERDRIQADINELQAGLGQILRDIPDWERAHRNAVRQLIRDTTAQVIDHLFVEVRAAYQDIPALVTYLEKVEQDIHEHVDEFLAAGKQRSEQTTTGKLEEDVGEFNIFRRYRINVMVQQRDGGGAPVIYEDHPTYQRLVGRIEHIAEQGTLLTDFNLIVPGALHRANGGYLVIDAERLLTNSFSWDVLKRSIRSQQLRIESVEELLSIGSTISLEPEAIPLQVTVVLIGSPYIYFLLSALDPETNELFKIGAELEPDVPRDEKTETEFAQLLLSVAQRDGLRPLDNSAAARIVEFAARLAGDAQRLSTNLATVFDLLQEADFCAQREQCATITAREVQAAIDARLRRADRLPTRIQEEIARNTLRIETSGAEIGQINGLSVIALGALMFGQPSRITAQVRLGRGEVIDIERQVHLGGPLHSKGVMILTGFIGGRFGRNCRLSLAASLVFEQSYGGVEGDSASAAELFALLSAIAQVPLKQSLAVTGSVDQRGQIQAIGGVNEKIEGFFDACKTRGFSGEQGVIIPTANAHQLMLRADIVEAAAAGTFHIYAMDSVDEGLEILTGLTAGVVGADGKYPPDSINGKVAQQLAQFAASAAESDKPSPAKLNGLVD